MDGHVSTNLKPSAKRGYESLLDNHILPVLKDRSLAAITRDEVKELCYTLLQEGRIRPKKTADKKVKDATLSARTVIYVVRTISAIYNHAIEDGIVQANPALRPGRFVKVGTRREKVDILSPAEGDLVLKTAEKHFNRTYPLLLTAMRTGMREGELLALEWGDIDWNSNFIEVRRATWRGITGTQKSGKTRRVDEASHRGGRRPF